ncbi:MULTISPECIES: rRNA maturation RNase YbeY [unclassified Helicobacter]|uniref:rRNA maturation RNase YbeY n=1 Tax=unclassified Helicobacter TaxID=2593540 RepID=UPI000CF01C58|nr:MULTISPECIES: rRNA maturation RNase YbeY [unclassified Helicobacter]
MLEVENQTKVDIDISFLCLIAETMSDRDIDLILVAKDTIQELNKLYRHKDTPTDVLSFPLDDMGGFEHIPLGSIAICVDIAQEVALSYKHSLEQEIALLLIHAILHLQGFDHEVDDGEHRIEEEKWIKFFKLPTSLITRNQ